MDGISPLCSTGHRPLSGPLPCHHKDPMLLNKQGKGTAVLMMPLGDLFLLFWLFTMAVFFLALRDSVLS